MKTTTGRLALLAAALTAVPSIAAAQTTWDGGGLADTSWGTAANWDNDTLPAFNGLDSLTVTGGFGANTALTLGADRSIARITFGGSATPISLSGNTLRLNSTTTTAAAGTALWNASTSDGQAAIVNSNLLLQSGSAGTYTAQFRENNNSSGGTTFNGTITQGAGENWTLRFSRASSRGTFRLNNASNSFAGIINAGADILSLTPGSYGSGLITLSGGTTGTATVEHYTTAVANDITLTSGGVWSSNIATRLTGNLTQGSQALTYQGTGGGFARADYASISGTGTTSVRSGTLWASTMSKLSSGTLNLADGTTAGFGSFVLSGTAASDAPTWDDFVGARTYNQSGGSGTWRINTTTTAGVGGGFAARGADVTIPHQSAPNAGGITNTTFARNFVLGSQATLNGVRIADHAVKVNTDIAFGTAEFRPVITWHPDTAAGSASVAWTLGGPVHELNGVLSGTDVELVPLSGGSSANRGLLRVTNANNALAGNSVWVLGSTRTSWVTPGGITITTSNPDDNSGVVGIFTSDAAFGGNNVEVVVASLGSSGTATNSLLLFEDASGLGTTFAKPFSVLNNTATYASGFGSYAGDVTYTGAINMPATQGTNGAVVVHVRSGEMKLGLVGDSADITNNRTAATTFYKEGAGTLAIDNLVFGGTQATNNWNVRGGTLLVNQALTTFVTVANTGTLGGVGSISGAVTVQNGGTVSPGMSIGNLSVGSLVVQNGGTVDIEVGASAADLLSVAGVLNLTAGTSDTLNLVSLIGGPTGAVPSYTIMTYGTRSGDFNVVSVDDVVVSTADAFNPLIGVPFPATNYYLAWDDSAGTLTLNAVPEPASLGLLAMGGLAMLRRRRGA